MTAAFHTAPTSDPSIVTEYITSQQLHNWTSENGVSSPHRVYKQKRSIMPSKITYSKVLVTGANAFYSAAIMDRLVKHQVMIHATVRSKSAAEPLESRYGDLIKV